MTLLLLEALLALLLLVFIVWWTMFSGRPKGELPPEDRPQAGAEPSAHRHPDEPR
jgi:hypothetical protein